MRTQSQTDRYNELERLAEQPVLYLVRIPMGDWGTLSAAGNKDLEAGTRWQLNEWAKRVACQVGEGAVVTGVETGRSGLNVWGLAYTRLSAEEIRDLCECELGEEDVFVQKVDLESTGMGRFTIAVFRTGESEANQVLKTSDREVAGGVCVDHYRSLIPEGAEEEEDQE